MVDEQSQNKNKEAAVHHNIACDGCDVCPIVGPRYKSIVVKDFDLCGMCEERLGHEHAMIKIERPD